MTQEMLYIDKSNIYFDCRNHSEMKDVCIMASTLCNVLITACRDQGIEPKECEDGHLSFDISDAPETLMHTFLAVQQVFCEIENQFPSYLMVY